MTNESRATVPDRIRTNGATPNPWWASAVVYQIYPRSFQDSNGDGIGDIPGIISRLDYLADLGVDVIWLSPVYKSPQNDNGYDISDYQAIDPMFGTMDDMDDLLREAHQRGIKVIMDLVVNHTSDEHPWFQASRDPADPHADWYWWRPARPGHKPGTPGAEPNHWGATFGGSAWQFDERRGEYYLHLFTERQPDLNWENPAVRSAVYSMMNWWMDRGIDGFRMDVITLISKTVDESGRLPGEMGSSIADSTVGETGYADARAFAADGPRLDEYLREMRHAVFDGRKGYLTVGESNVTPERSSEITDPANGELDMLFVFNHLEGDGPDGSKWGPVPLSIPKLKRILATQQDAARKRGWPTVFFDNHDQPRVVSRWGSDADEASRVASAKALALLLFTHRGTPYMYQGEELGMTNAHFTSLDQYRDVDSLVGYRERVEERRIQSRESMLAALAAHSRDNARTPMQWDSSRYAGFMSGVDADHSAAGAEDAPGVKVSRETSGSSQQQLPQAFMQAAAEQAADNHQAAPYAEPWIAVNPNYIRINAAVQMEDPDSIRSFFKRMIALRQSDEVLIAGTWNLLDAADEQVYAYTRELNGRRLLVAVNLSGKSACVPDEAWHVLTGLAAGAAVASVQIPHPEHFIIATSDVEGMRSGLDRRRLPAWQGFVVEC